MHIKYLNVKKVPVKKLKRIRGKVEQKNPTLQKKEHLRNNQTCRIEREGDKTEMVMK